MPLVPLRADLKSKTDQNTACLSPALPLLICLIDLINRAWNSKLPVLICKQSILSNYCAARCRLVFWFIKKQKLPATSLALMKTRLSDIARQTHMHTKTQTDNQTWVYAQTYVFMCICVCMHTYMPQSCEELDWMYPFNSFPPHQLDLSCILVHEQLSYTTEYGNMYSGCMFSLCVSNMSIHRERVVQQVRSVVFSRS